MPVDASIYGALGARPMSALDYSDAMDRSALRQQSLQTNALAMQQSQQKIYEYSRGLNEQGSVRNALMGLGTGATDEQRIQAMRGTKAMTEIASSVKRYATGVMAAPTRESAMAAIDNIEAMHKQFGLPGNFDSDRQVVAAANSPQEITKWAAGNLSDANLLIAKFVAHNNGKVQTFADMNPITNPAGPAPITMTTTPGEDLTARTSTANNAATNATHVQTTGMTNATSRANNAATVSKDFAVAGLNPDGTMRGMSNDGGGKIDLSKVAPEDMAAAYRYKSDGTLPPNMGRGQQGAAESRRLRAIASALDDQAGESPEDARIRQLALKGDVTAVNQMRRREVAVGANVKNFDFNADQVLELSKKVDRSGVPIVNAWLNAGRRSLTGNPELSAFDVAVKTTVNEFAQIVSGTTAGATTEGEKKKAEQLLNAQQTPEQIIAVINQMRVESENRMKSFADQRKQSMPTNRAGGSPAAPAGAPPPAKTGSGATVSKW